MPLPLGGNVIRRDLGPEMIRTVSKMLHDSIAHALSNRAAAVEYAQAFGRGLDRKDTDTFVGMYVNQLTLDYGTRGRAGLERFFGEAYEKKLIKLKYKRIEEKKKREGVGRHGARPGVHRQALGDSRQARSHAGSRVNCDLGPAGERRVRHEARHNGGHPMSATLVFGGQTLVSLTASTARVVKLAEERGG